MTVEDDDLDPSIDKKWMLTPEQQQKLNDDGADSKFEVFFDAPYAEIKAAMSRHIKSGFNILDIGANQGNLEDYLENSGGQYQIQCVDIDAQALDKLDQKQYQNIETSIVQSDANSFIENYEGIADQNAILLNATLHEINSPADQRQYLEQLFAKARAILKADGIIIIGDYYYPDDVTDVEVARFTEYQKKAINHADARNKFVKPELIEEVAADSGFNVEEAKEIRAVQEIDRRYYVIVLKRKE